MNYPSIQSSLIGREDLQLDVRFRNECLAPEVDHELLRRLARKELSRETSRMAFRLIHSFESWRNAHADVVVEEFQRTQQAS